MRSFIAALKLLAFALLCFAVVPPQIIILFFTKGAASRILPFIWMKAVCSIFRIRVNIQGTPYKAGQVLNISNHLSYLDIPVIGSVLSCSFVSKNDVAKWPVFGFLANLRQTAYIGRTTGDLKSASRAVSSFIERGESLILFPEGTSTDGREVIPFKSSLFSLALKGDDTKLEQLALQPLTVQVLSSDGRNIVTQNDRDLYAWHRDMSEELPEHLWRFAKTRGADVSLTFHTPLYARDYSDRKTLAKVCHKAVSNGLQNSITNTIL